ncbi:lipopolysaccharide-induced tumor necrosis factor-alpha factor-like [Tropilaelaps mercedesae]|uniref:Lipopolysaccharide-induced tumor necrosis factor-alpha factor-like n=1 Tax=Tropilaelaps mercedesae TaxID=418985 RepID=A0A1V9X1P5_9ACAR|nr:lipopolysaccharide-induced tumor necrosis factor-alpha factor-like [Tropilaelaps mercedesae]
MSHILKDFGELQQPSSASPGRGSEVSGVVAVPRQWPSPSLTYGPHQMRVQCPHCATYVTTKIEYSAGMFSYVAAFVLMAMGCFCGCCLIPCCSAGFKNAEHFCPKCNNYLGIYNRC